jgi:hypothetical protein
MHSPPGGSGGFFVPAKAAPKSQAFPAIRAMLRGGNFANHLKLATLFSEVTQFRHFSPVNRINFL